MHRTKLPSQLGLNWTLGKVAASRLYSSVAAYKSTRSPIEPNEARGRVKQIERKAIEFLYKFLGRCREAQDMTGGSSIAETRYPDDIL